MKEYSLQEAYAICADHTRAEAKNFYYAFILLPTARRKAIYALYSFCRTVDDAADEAPSFTQAQHQLQELRKELQACLDGMPRGALFIALADAIRQFDLNPRYLTAIIDGVEQDLTINRYADFSQLRDYCWKVASAVGLLSLSIFGYTDPEAEKHAEDLGLAMQLTNILRDVKEDLERDRIYLPQDELKRFGVSHEDLNAEHPSDAFKEFAAFQAARARQYFTSGRRLVPLVAYSSRICPLMLQTTYESVLDHIEKADFDVFSQRRGPDTGEKIRLLLGACGQCLLP